MIHSIRGRLLILAAVWISVALLAAFLFISQLLEDFVTNRFDAEANAFADVLAVSLHAEDTGDITLESEPIDPRFSLPLSGWYWQVDAGPKAVARSPSLLDGRLNGPTGNFTGGHGLGADQALLRVLRREISIPDTEQLIGITITAPQTQIDENLQQISRPLGVALAVLGVGLAIASLVQITLGLQSLDRLRHDLASVRTGSILRLPAPDVSELRPLAADINASLDQNTTLLTRSRQHLGNLAHSLKTPLAALSNELPADHTGQGLITRMDRLIGWHLRRARSAGPGTLGQSTAVRTTIDDILLVLKWPILDKNISVEIDCAQDIFFAGEQQDLEEMIGNLTENAVKWGQSRLAIKVTRKHDRLTISIEDDGPGLAGDAAMHAMTRGARLDEFGPAGSGLGLAIVADLAALHGGELSLTRAEIGGLAANLVLPAAF